MKFLSVAIFICATLLKFSNSEYFSSTEELKNLRGNDQNFVKLLREFSNELEKKNLFVKNKLKEIEEEHEFMKKDIENYIFNPLNAYNLIKRLTHDISMLQENFKFVSEFSAKANSIKLNENEFNGAVEGLYRLQETYELKSDDLVKGIIQDKKYRKALPLSDVFVLAKEMFKFDENLAHDYIDIAKQMNADPITKLKNLEELFYFYNTTSRYKNALETLDDIMTIDQDLSKYQNLKMNIEHLLHHSSNVKAEEFQNSNQYVGNHYTKIKESLIFSKACRGELEKSIKDLSQLHCRYISNTYFTKIAPFKLIEANLNPFVAIYLDVISDQEIELLKSFASQDLNRAEVLGNHTETKVSRVRIAKLNWQQDTKHEIYEKLTTRVHHMTGLNMKYAEQWQVQNYGIGGFYDAHHDYASENQEFKDNNGNRIATALFYLSDVEKGGGTVFPLLRIHVPPRKGTAVFWYNLSTSGDREQLTRHAACPVLIGSKWVANKWMREKGQESSRPCELIPRKTDENYYLHFYNLKDYGIYI